MDTELAIHTETEADQDKVCNDEKWVLGLFLFPTMDSTFAPSKSRFGPTVPSQ